MSGKSVVKLALIQLKVTSEVTTNLNRARQKAIDAAKNGAGIIVLPECFNSPYGTQYFPKYAESINGPSAKALSSIAKECKTYLVGGSFPEKTDDGKIFNTCTIWNPEGDLIATHRKIHLFDIDIPGKIKFKESDILSPGNTLTNFQTPWGRFSVGICYDMRFPELATIAARTGSIGMIYPGAFNTVTGPLHWELLLRARAVDNQFFVAGCSPARDESASYHAWGHSTIVDPSGKVISTTDEAESIIYGDLDIGSVNEIKDSIPISHQRRFDIYKDVSKTY